MTFELYKVEYGQLGKEKPTQKVGWKIIAELELHKQKPLISKLYFYYPNHKI